ncbi:hypothetical protein GF319_11000 [Candidatus Bathyarchaeota archaeon]|nr:hypothetical protein [Candidatus Bathyarchaeota archaeon]
MINNEHPLKTIIEKAKERSLSKEQAQLLAYTYIDSALRDINIHVDSNDLESSKEYQSLRTKLQKVIDNLLEIVYNSQKKVYDK